MEPDGHDDEDWGYADEGNERNPEVQEPLEEVLIHEMNEIERLYKHAEGHFGKK